MRVRHTLAAISSVQIPLVTAGMKPPMSDKQCACVCSRCVDLCGQCVSVCAHVRCNAVLFGLCVCCHGQLCIDCLNRQRMTARRRLIKTIHLAKMLKQSAVSGILDSFIWSSLLWWQLEMISARNTCIVTSPKQIRM